MRILLTMGLLALITGCIESSKLKASSKNPSAKETKDLKKGPEDSDKGETVDLKSPTFNGVSIDKLSDSQVDLSSAETYIKGKSFDFFTMAGDKKTKYFIRLKEGKAEEFGRKQALGKMGISDAIAVNDDLFAIDDSGSENEDFIFDLFDSYSLMRLSKENKGSELQRVEIAQGNPSTIFKLRDGALIGLTTNHIIFQPLNRLFFDGEKLSLPMAANILRRKVASNGLEAYSVGFDDSEIPGLWHFKSAVDKPVKIPVPWTSSTIVFDSLIYEKISKSFIVQYQDLPEKKKTEGEGYAAHALIGPEGMVSIGRGPRVYSSDAGVLVGNAYYYSGYKTKPSKWSKNEKYLVSVDKYGSLFLPEVEPSSEFQYFKAKNDFYATDLDRGLLYKLRSDGRPKLLKNEVKKTPKARYFASDGAIFLKSQDLYIIDGNSGRASKIALPSEVKSFEEASLCEQSFLLMYDANKQLFGVGLLKANGALDMVKDIPKGLLRAKKIPSSEGDSLVIAGHLANVWKMWRLSCGAH